MRKVIPGAGLRLDGGVEFFYQPKGYSMAATLDVVAFGCTTFDAAVKHGGGSYKSPMGMPAYGLSKSKPHGGREGVTFTDQTPAAGKHIFAMGGGELARSFLQDDLVDELYLGIYPVVLGDGILFLQGRLPRSAISGWWQCKTYEPHGMLEVRCSHARE